MEEDKKIDKLFNEKLNQQQFEIPDAFLADLNSRLDNTSFPIQKRSKRGFFFFFTVLFLLVAVISSALFLYQSSSSKSSSIKHSNETSHSKETSSNTKSAEKSNSNRTEKSDDTSVASNQNPQGNKLNLRSKENKIADLSNSSKGDKKADRTKKAKQKKRKKSPSAGNLAGNDSNSGEKYTAEGKSSGAPTFDPTSVSDPNDTLNPDLISAKKEEKKDSTQIAQNDTTRVTQQDSSKTASPTVKPEKTKPTWTKEVQLFAGMNGSLYQNQSIDANYLAVIENAQSSVMSPAVGANFQLYRNKINAGSGVHFTQYGERFERTTSELILEDSIYIAFFTTDSVFNEQTQLWEEIQIPNYDTLHVEKEVENTLSVLNRYSWISVPLHFGYRFDVGNYSIIPRVGAQFDFGIGQKQAQFPGQDSVVFVNFTPTKLIVSYAVQLELRRTFDQWHVFVNPYFRSAFSPTISDAILERRYRVWGVNLGVGLRF